MSNKKTAVAFLNRAFVDGEPEEAVAEHVGSSYVQHSPGAADGIDAFVSFAKKLHAECPDLRLDVRRVLGDGDLVAVHMRVTGLAPVDTAVVDLYRFDDDGRIIEHWDVVQQAPADSANENGMF